MRNEFDYPAYRVSMSSMFSVAALVTTVLNSLILISIWKTPSLHKPSYILIGSLALSDVLVGAIGEPLMIMDNVTDLQGWSVDNFCLVSTLAKIVNYALGGISLFTLMLISVDRLLAVKLRNRYQSVVTKKRALLILVACWITMSAVSAVSFAFFEVSSQILSALLLFVGITAVILVVTITVCYSMAFYTLRKITSSSVSPSVQNAEAVPHPSSTNPNIDVPKYRRSLITMFLVFLLIVIFYMPLVSVSLTFFMVFSSKNVSSQTLSYDIFLICVDTGELFSLLNSAVNPLLYLWRIRDIREAVNTTVKTALKIV